MLHPFALRTTQLGRAVFVALAGKPALVAADAPLLMIITDRGVSIGKRGKLRKRRKL
jgi:hypothetical protein